MARMTELMYFKNLRCHWPSYFSIPNDPDGEPTKPQGVFMFDKKDPEHQVYIETLRKHCKALCETNNDAVNPETKKGRILKPDRICFKDGDLEERSEFHGYWVLKTKTATGPGHTQANPVFTLPAVIGTDGRSIITDPSAKPVFYAGCRVNCKVRLKWYSNPKMPSHGKYVTGEFIAVQFAGDDEPLSSNHVSEKAQLEGFGETDYKAPGEADWGDEEATVGTAHAADDDDGEF